jgi:hypothetical protein
MLSQSVTRTALSEISILTVCNRYSECMPIDEFPGRRSLFTNIYKYRTTNFIMNYFAF